MEEYGNQDRVSQTLTNRVLNQEALLGLVLSLKWSSGSLRPPGTRVPSSPQLPSVALLEICTPRFELQAGGGTVKGKP